MSEKLYRISWEMVGQRALAKYCNADPLMFKNVTQVVPNSQIPDEDWHPASRETSDPWQQYHQLKRWADADTEFVRNVRLEVQANEPTWLAAPSRPTVADERGEGS